MQKKIHDIVFCKDYSIEVRIGDCIYAKCYATTVRYEHGNLIKRVRSI